MTPEQLNRYEALIEEEESMDNRYAALRNEMREIRDACQHEETHYPSPRLFPNKEYCSHCHRPIRRKDISTRNEEILG